MASSALELHIIKSGLFTTVQDAGRRGLGSFGVPVGGWLDEKSARQANWLVGNHPDTPVLEMTIQGPVIQFSGSGQISITGADISPQINQTEIPLYQTIDIENGDILSFGKLQKGCRAYLAVRGRWMIEKELESYGLLFSGKITPGQKGLIQRGGNILIKSRDFIRPKVIRIKETDNPLTIRALPGPEFKWFSREDIGYFFSYTYRVSSDSNRMGCRLEGHYLIKENDQELISSGVIPGTVQITNQGQPVILLADAQTTGGYPRFAVIKSEDLHKIGQSKPGDKVRFVMGR